MGKAKSGGEGRGEEAHASNPTGSTSAPMYQPLSLTLSPEAGRGKRPTARGGSAKMRPYAEFRIRAHLAGTPGPPACSRLCVIRNPGGPPVNTHLLSHIHAEENHRRTQNPLRTIRRQGVAAAVSRRILSATKMAPTDSWTPSPPLEAHHSPQVRQSFLNPNGIVSSSPGLRAASYPGLRARSAFNPERVVARCRSFASLGRSGGVLQPFQG